MVFILVLVFLVSCNKDDEDEDTTPDTSPSPTPQELDSITVDLSTTYQTIAGFGGCNGVFRGSSNFPNAADMQKAFGTGDNELGLTIFRVSVPPSSNQWAAIAAVALLAQNHGAKVMASPWDAPPALLDPDVTYEDKIDPSNYGAYVEHLNEYNSFMIDNGVNLYAISVQNEPDIGEWTQWSTQEVFTFTRDYAHGINNNVITAESYNFNRAYYNYILNDSTASANIEIVGGHIYGGGLGDIPAAREQGKEIWMTEYLLNEYTDTIPENSWTSLSESQIWGQSLEMLNTVHESMVSNWNAYIWWYLKRYYCFIGDGLEGSNDGEILKRGYAFSHFSRFVRPGYVRVEVQNPKLTNLKVTAYEGDGKVVIQILNPTASSIAQFKIGLKEYDVTSAEAYITSEYRNRESIPIEIEGGQAVTRASSKSITTVLLEI